MHQTSNEVELLSDSSLDSLQLEASLEKEVVLRGKEIITQEFLRQHSVAKEEDMDKFECFPSGFDVNPSQDNNNNNNRTSMNNDHLEKSISISENTDMVGKDFVITDENTQIQDEIGYEDVATDSTSKRRGIKR